MVAMRVISALEGQHLQVEHDLEMLVEGFRHAHGRLGHLQIGRDRVRGLLDAPLDLANIVQILA